MSTCPKRQSKPFFSSTTHPGLHMNKYGVVMADRAHPLADSDVWRGVSWEIVPLKNGTLAIQNEVSDEAYAAGYRWRWLKNGERLWSKPKRESKVAS